MTDLFRDGYGNPRVKGGVQTMREDASCQTSTVVFDALTDFDDSGAVSSIIINENTIVSGEAIYIWAITAVTGGIAGTKIFGGNVNSYSNPLLAHGDVYNTFITVPEGPFTIGCSQPIKIPPGHGLVYNPITAGSVVTSTPSYLTVYYTIGKA